MRYVDGESYYTVGEVSAAAGVSAQTVRIWERSGALRSQRTPGGHRLFDKVALQTAVERAATQRRRTARTNEPVSESIHENHDLGFAATGARIRAARQDAGLSQRVVADKAGISRSLLSSIERGETGLSVHVFSRLADVLGLPMSGFAPPRPAGERLMRLAQRPRSVFPDGIAWEELAAPGHTIAPAIVSVPAGAGSGGMVTLIRENFVLILDGRLTFEFVDDDEEVELCLGDALVIPAGLTHSWINRADMPARAVWVEQLR